MKTGSTLAFVPEWTHSNAFPVLLSDSVAPIDVSLFIVIGLSVVCGLWWLAFPNSVNRVSRAIYGPRFCPRPFFIRLPGGVWIAVSLWIFGGYWRR